MTHASADNRSFIHAVPPRTVVLLTGGTKTEQARFAGTLWTMPHVLPGARTDRAAYQARLPEFIDERIAEWFAPEGPALVPVMTHGWLDGDAGFVRGRLVAAGVSAATLDIRRASSLMVHPARPLAHIDDSGPFDIVGDIHGCADELRALLAELGYDWRSGIVTHPEGRRLVSVGDLTDRGPDPVFILDLISRSVTAGSALWVMGNHDANLLNWLRGCAVTRGHGAAETFEILNSSDKSWRDELVEVMACLATHLVLDGGALVVTHGGIEDWMVGRESPRIAELNKHGLKTGLVTPDGLSVRGDWQSGISGQHVVVYGHEPHQEVKEVGTTVGLDTGCFAGNALTALRWPEQELVSVPAKRVYAARGGILPTDDTVISRRPLSLIPSPSRRP